MPMVSPFAHEREVNSYRSTAKLENRLNHLIKNPNLSALFLKKVLQSIYLDRFT
jgi:hypothetical protein